MGVMIIVLFVTTALFPLPDSKIMTAVINYCANKFIPYILVGVLLFSCMGATAWEPYIILGFICFIDRFSWKTGYAVAYCEENGIDPLEPPE